MTINTNLDVASAQAELDRAKADLSRLGDFAGRLELEMADDYEYERAVDAVVCQQDWVDYCEAMLAEAVQAMNDEWNGVVNAAAAATGRTILG